jgi:5-methylcytosine-specific restriction endonuclease McrA
VRPLAPERFAIHFTIGKETHDKLRHVQALLSHRLPSGDIAQVFDRALDALLKQLEKQKYAATKKPRTPRASRNPRHIPAHVKRAVKARDGDQCTFVSASGQRCSSRKFLQFDHTDPVARGGEATVDNVRLLCRGHNQHAAERAFGAGFMHEKREAARRAAASARARASVGARAHALSTAAFETPAHAGVAAAETLQQAATAEPHACADFETHTRDVMSSLRGLGFRAGEARPAVEFSATLPDDATLEERVRTALQFLCPRPRAHDRKRNHEGLSGEVARSHVV